MQQRLCPVQHGNAWYFVDDETTLFVPADQAMVLLAPSSKRLHDHQHHRSREQHDRDFVEDAEPTVAAAVLALLKSTQDLAALVVVGDHRQHQQQFEVQPNGVQDCFQ